MTAKPLLAEISQELDCAPVQHIGNILVLWREKPAEVEETRPATRRQAADQEAGHGCGRQAAPPRASLPPPASTCRRSLPGIAALFGNKQTANTFLRSRRAAHQCLPRSCQTTSHNPIRLWIRYTMLDDAMPGRKAIAQGALHHLAWQGVGLELRQ
jgi:hypothetical protein